MKSICTRAIVLENGFLTKSGETNAMINYYIKGRNKTQNKKVFKDQFKNSRFQLHEISLNVKGRPSDEVLNEYHEIELHTKISIFENPQALHILYVLNNEHGDTLFTFTHKRFGLELKDGYNDVVCYFPKGFLNIGAYFLSIYIIENSKTKIFIEKDIISFDVQVGERAIGAWMGREPGFIKPVFEWEIIN